MPSTWPSFVRHDKINYCHHRRHRFLAHACGSSIVGFGELFAIEMAVGMDASALPPAAVLCRLMLRAENAFKVATS